MKLMDFLDKRAIIPVLEKRNKEEVVREMVDKLVALGEIKDSEETVRILLEREKLGSTGIGEGVAIPHGKSKDVKKIAAVFAKAKEGVDFEALDGEPVYLFFLLVAPESSTSEHIKALARISRLLKDSNFRKKLKMKQSAEEILSAISEEDKRQP
ncbi:MAG: PTS sugar transporter subunit IIA [bacterium]